ncbi:MAG: hypothetical protein A2309_02900 [Bacteroidetes bacterium RIFOXYB2_FULL_35_7]|nr:MAG: hypothetical protein A2309_02900 [Bacteroidetes bacterium RIFOXYB2_FULL_35_7]
MKPKHKEIKYEFRSLEILNMSFATTIKDWVLIFLAFVIILSLTITIKSLEIKEIENKLATKQDVENVKTEVIEIKQFLRGKK